MGSLREQGDGSWRNGWLCLAVVILAVTTVGSGEETTTNSVRDLRAKIFEHYDKLVRPVVNQNTTTTVYLGVTPVALTDVDEDKQIFEMDAFIYMKWKDEYLVWNPEEYGGVTSFNIPSTEIWRPDICIYNASPAKKVVIEVFTNAIVNNTGDVLWVPPVTFHTRCPHGGERSHDSLTCTVKLGSWTYHEYKLNLQLEHDEVQMKYLSNSNPYWDLASMTANRRSKHYDCCVEPYPEINYNITVRRRSSCRACKKTCSGPQSHHH